MFITAVTHSLQIGNKPEVFTSDLTFFTVISSECSSVGSSSDPDDMQSEQVAVKCVPSPHVVPTSFHGTNVLQDEHSYILQCKPCNTVNNDNCNRMMSKVNIGYTGATDVYKYYIIMEWH